jgi:hypothetical protein
MTTESKGLAGEAILQVCAENYCFNFTIDAYWGRKAALAKPPFGP